MSQSVGKVTICHSPPGNPDNQKTISVGSPAVDAHLAHGDYLGECVEACRITGETCTSSSACCVGVCAAGTCVIPICTAGETDSCYTGPLATDEVGACQRGTETCNATGTAWSTCSGSVTPVTEVCDDDIDNDCDGLVDEDCTVCTAEVCGDGLDNNCDGLVDDGCIGNWAWNDSNPAGPADGLQGLGEAGLAGVVFTLRTTVGVPVQVATSGLDGAYYFSGVAPGAYYVSVAFPATPPTAPFWAPATRDVGVDDTIDSDFSDDDDTGNIRTADFTYAGSAMTHIDCGAYLTGGG